MADTAENAVRIERTTICSHEGEVEEAELIPLNDLEQSLSDARRQRYQVDSNADEARSA